jgi:hypothetical protein
MDSEDRNRPHFSLKEMKVIPAYKGPKRVLFELMREIEWKVHLFRKDCWNIAAELVADHLGIIENPWKYSLPDVKWAGPKSKPHYPQFQELKKQIGKTGLIEQYIEEAKKEPWDHFGDIFVEEELAGKVNRLGQCLTPRGIIEFMIKACLEPGIKRPYPYKKPDMLTRIWLTDEALKFNDKLAQISINLQAERARWHTVIGMRPLLVKYDQEPMTDLDPTVGTGRFLIMASQMYPEAPLLLYGIEIDVSLYRVCLVNMALFSKHPYSIVCADTLRLDRKYSMPGGDLWSQGNQWDPPDISKFYIQPTPPFSLKEYAKTVKIPTVPMPIPQQPAFSLAQYAKKFDRVLANPPWNQDRKKT